MLNALRKLLTVSVVQEKGGTAGNLSGLGYAFGLNDCEDESSVALADFSTSVLIA